jgi:hypothetical protein
MLARVLEDPACRTFILKCMGYPPLHADERLLRRHRPQQQAGILRDEALSLLAADLFGPATVQ